jgi:hypothetical protein
MEDDDAKRAMEELEAKRQEAKEHYVPQLYSGPIHKRTRGIFDHGYVWQCGFGRRTEQLN